MNKKTKKQKNLDAHNSNDVETLIKLNLGLVHSACQKYSAMAHMKGFTYDDIFSLALEGLWYTCKHWKPEKGAFTTIAVPNIQKYILRYINAHKYHLISSTNTVYTPLDKALADATVEKSPLDELELSRMASCLRDKVLLPETLKRRAYGALMYLNGYSGEEIGKELGVSRMAAHNWCMPWLSKRVHEVYG